MCFNQTSINKQVVSKILNACKESLSNESGQAYVNNKKGVPFIRVKKVKKRNGEIGFQILDKNQNDLVMLLGKTLVINRKAPKICNKKFANGLSKFISKRFAYPYEIV
jgi:hypothetical protein